MRQPVVVSDVVSQGTRKRTYTTSDHLNATTIRCRLPAVLCCVEGFRFSGLPLPIPKTLCMLTSKQTDHPNPRHSDDMNDYFYAYGKHSPSDKPYIFTLTNWPNTLLSSLTTGKFELCQRSTSWERN
jgi:hypothetical protein